MKNHLLLGNWNSLCDSCGRKFKASSLKKRWDGLMVCEEDWEQRHPQDLLRVQREQISVPWARPYPATDTYIPENLWAKPVDNLGLNEKLAVDFKKLIQDVYQSSGMVNGMSLNSLVLNGSMYSGTPLETFKFTETFNAALARFVADSTGISETFVKQFKKNIQENVPLGESWYFTETEHTQESLSLAEGFVTLFTKTLTESFAVSETTTISLLSSTTVNGTIFNKLPLG